MSAPNESIELTRSQERMLDDFARTSDFWSRVRAGYATYHGLTPRQHELFIEQVEKDAWKAKAQRLDGVPVRNHFRTDSGRPRCADRAKPFCENAAAIIVGTFAFCELHAPAAKEQYDAYIAARREKRAQGKVAEPSGGWGDEIDGGGADE